MVTKIKQLAKGLLKDEGAFMGGDHEFDQIPIPVKVIKPLIGPLPPLDPDDLSGFDVASPDSPEVQDYITEEDLKEAVFKLAATPNPKGLVPVTPLDTPKGYTNMTFDHGEGSSKVKNNVGITVLFYKDTVTHSYVAKLKITDITMNVAIPSHALAEKGESDFDEHLYPVLASMLTQALMDGIGGQLKTAVSNAVKVVD